MIQLVSTPIVLASSMTLATDSNYSNQTDKFNASQTIYLKVEANNSGEDKREINLRNNNYDLLKTYPLTNIGSNTFISNIEAPASDGYYSLEAKIESKGTNSTSVKIFKVGSDINSSVKVNVNSSTKSSTSNNSVLGDESKKSQEENLKPSPTPTPTPQNSPQSTASNEAPKSIFQKIYIVIHAIFGSMWLLKSIF